MRCMEATPPPRNKPRDLLTHPLARSPLLQPLALEVELFVTSHRARITWAPRGGTGSLPTTLQYATIARFAEDDSWPNDAWSIVCAFEAPPVLQRNPAERSEEHTSELQSHVNLVCRLLLEKKKKQKKHQLKLHN